MVREDQSSQLVVPDDEVGVAVVDLGQVRGLVPVQMCSPPLDVASAPHQRRHRPLHSLRLGLGVLDQRLVNIMT